MKTPFTCCTTASAQRVANMRLIIEAIRAAGTIARDDIAILIGMSPSGGRKYIHTLMFEEVLEIVGVEPALRKCHPGAPIYALNADSSIISAFLERLEAMPVNLKQKLALVDHSGPGPRMQKVQAEDGRSIHMLRDDVVQRPRSSKFRIPEPDPVLAHFYGFVSAGA